MISPAIRLLRPRQWIKNGFVLAPMFFAGLFTQPLAWKISLEAALCFLCMSCCVYIINDVQDVAEDRTHPVKKHRPLASGRLPVAVALAMLCGFAVLAGMLLLRLPAPCAAVAMVYVGLNVLYTFYLKQIAIIDIFFIAFCYVLRVLMGGYALDVRISPWIVLATFLLALFLACGKRYHELGFEEYARARANLRHYNRNLLDRMLVISAGSALMTYAIYAAEVATRIGKTEMIYTVGFVAFGLFRYLQSIYVYGKGGEPEAILFKDKLQLANAFAWLAVTLAIMFS